MRYLMIWSICLYCALAQANESDKVKITALEARVKELELQISRVEALRVRVREARAEVTRAAELKVEIEAKLTAALTIREISDKGGGLTVTMNNGTAFRVPEVDLATVKQWKPGDTLVPTASDQIGMLRIVNFKFELFGQSVDRGSITLAKCPFTTALSRIGDDHEDAEQKYVSAEKELAIALRTLEQSDPPAKMTEPPTKGTEP